MCAINGIRGVRSWEDFNAIGGGTINYDYISLIRYSLVHYSNTNSLPIVSCCAGPLCRY